MCTCNEYPSFTLTDTLHNISMDGIIFKEENGITLMLYSGISRWIIQILVQLTLTHTSFYNTNYMYQHGLAKLRKLLLWEISTFQSLSNYVQFHLLDRLIFQTSTGTVQYLHIPVFGCCLLRFSWCKIMRTRTSRSYM